MRTTSRTAIPRAWFETQIVGLLDQLFGAALRLEKNREDAEDLVMEAILKAWRHRRSLNKERNFKAWIFRILTNSFLSHCRKRSLRPVTKHGIDECDDEFWLFEKLHQPFLLWWSNPEQEFLSKLLRDDIEQAVDSLPEGCRVVVVLADVEGLSYQEIARILNLPVGTVRSRLSRGRSRLQKALWQHALEAGFAKIDERKRV